MFVLELFLISFLLSSYSIFGSEDPPPNSVALKVINAAGAPIDLFWKNTFEPGEQLVKQLDVPIRNSSETTINSYDSHVFVVRFVNPKLTFEVEFEKLPEPEVVTVTFSPGLGLIVDQRTKFHDMVDKVDVALQSCLDNATGEIKSDCVAEYVLGDHLRLEASKNHLKKVRDKIAHKLRNYTCGDPNIESTKPFNTHSLYIGNGVGHTKYTVNDIFEHTHSKIWTIEDFVSDEECDILMRHGKPRLTRATVAAADGSNIVSEARKANQAVYNVRSVADPLYSLSNRILAVANKKNNMQLQSDGQESFTIIQYDENDEYAPHCDGSCDATEHKDGGRVATAVLYCKIPEAGGGTAFSAADVFVKPKKNMATFFSYYNPEDNLMDDGYTEHSGCPILKGEKWITTFWMRKGVTTEEPWDIYDPSGIKLLTADGLDFGFSQYEEL